MGLHLVVCVLCGTTTNGERSPWMVHGKNESLKSDSPTCFSLREPRIVNRDNSHVEHIGCIDGSVRHVLSAAYDVCCPLLYRTRPRPQPFFPRH